MYRYLLDVYSNAVREGSENDWNTAISFLDEGDVWQGIQAKLRDMNGFVYPFAGGDYTDIDELIDAVRNYVDEDDRYNQLYGKNNSEDVHLDLIELAKLMALYKHERNYHFFLLCDGIVEDDVLFQNKIYLMPHSDLCVLKNRNRNGRKFDLIPFEDLLQDFAAVFRLRNSFNDEGINPAQTIAHHDCPFRQRYLDASAEYSGRLSKSTFHALKAFIEVVSNEFDAHNSLDSCFYRSRVATKYEAFLDLCGFLESLPPDELTVLNNVRLDGHYTFLAKMNGVKQGSCASQFADDLTKIVYQCDNAVQFTNPRAQQIIETNRNSLVLRGTIYDTSDLDMVYLANLQKIILNTTFRVRIGTKVSAGESSNRVPSHVAEMFNYCAKGLAGEMDPGEAKYLAIAVAAQCYRRPHNSILFFLNTRDETTHNFYGMTITNSFEKIIDENDSLHEHEDFLCSAPTV